MADNKQASRCLAWKQKKHLFKIFAGVGIFYLLSLAGTFAVVWQNASHKTEALLSFATTDLSDTVDEVVDAVLSNVGVALADHLGYAQPFTGDVMRQMAKDYNVDPSTGNIEYDGNVLVNGNVCTNFSVKAKGDVEVKGVVEGATVEAGGNITIARGMNGMGKGVLKCDGNVIAKFIENSDIEAGGYVETGSIMHSNVVAGSEIHVQGKKGFISGGKVTATTLIETRILGSDMGTSTIWCGHDSYLLLSSFPRG